MLSKKRPLTKWSCVVLRNSRSTLSTTSEKARQIIEWTLVCVRIHLECWLDKARAESLLGLQWVWHANSNSVTIQFQNFGSVNAIDVDWIRIQCASGECEFNSHSNRIKCEKAYRREWSCIERLLDRQGSLLVVADWFPSLFWVCFASSQRVFTCACAIQILITPTVATIREQSDWADTYWQCLLPRVARGLNFGELLGWC